MHRPAIAVALAVALMTGSVGLADDETVDLATRQLERAVTPQVGGRHLPLLTALRQLRDPAMLPMLFQLVQSDDPLIQVQAVLGAAELSEHGSIDPWLVTQIDPSVHDLVITEALDQGLLHDEQIDELLRWDGLLLQPRLLLWAERIHRSSEPPITVLHEKTESAEQQKELRAFALAACLLAERGDESALGRYRETLGTLGRRDRLTELRWIAEAIRQYELRRSMPLVDDALAAAGRSDLDLVSTALLAGLAIDPAAGLGRWRRVLDEDDSYPRRVRLGLILLAADVAGDAGASVPTGSASPAPSRIPASAYDALGDDEPLIAAIAAVGRARSAERDATDQLEALVDLGHGPSGDWATMHLERLPSDQARRLAVYLLELPETPSTARMTYAVRGASYLAKQMPELAVRLLSEAPDDGIRQEALLLGLMDARGPAVTAAAIAVPRSGPGRADSTAIVLLARNADTLSPDDQRHLGIVAAGGGRVGDLLQVQASWLYLKHTGRLDAALARVTVD